MKRLHGLDQVRKDKASVLTVGTFDGVHLGHQAILQYLQERARARDGLSTVLSFHPHPREIVEGAPLPLLTTIDERADLMAAMGLEQLIVLPFTKEFSRLPAEAFVEDVLVRGIGVREIVIGYDHAFGRDRRGNADLLRTLGARHGFTVDTAPTRIVADQAVSSRKIRRFLEEDGDADAAATMLGRPYSLEGQVVRGAGRGRDLGFPTANIAATHPRKAIPAHGVYAVRVRRAAKNPDTALMGMMNIGVRPTFDGARRTLEVHLLDLNEDLYDEILRVEFVSRMRGERRFGSKNELATQLSEDKVRCRRILEGS